MQTDCYQIDQINTTLFGCFHHLENHYFPESQAMITVVEWNGAISLIWGSSRFFEAVSRGEQAVAVIQQSVVSLNEAFQIAWSQLPVALLTAVQRCELWQSLNHAFVGETSLVASWVLPKTETPELVRLKAIRTIANWPVSVREFCSQKKINFRSLLQLTRYNATLLDTVLNLPFVFSQTLYTQIVEMVSDCLKRDQLSLENWLGQPELKALYSKTEVAVSARILWQWMHRQRYPSLYQENQKKQACIDALNLPKQVEIEWDRTLENQGFSVIITIKKPDDVRVITDHVSQKEWSRFYNHVK